MRRAESSPIGCRAALPLDRSSSSTSVSSSISQSARSSSVRRERSARAVCPWAARRQCSRTCRSGARPGRSGSGSSLRRALEVEHVDVEVPGLAGGPLQPAELGCESPAARAAGTPRPAGAARCVSVAPRSGAGAGTRGRRRSGRPRGWPASPRAGARSTATAAGIGAQIGRERDLDLGPGGDGLTPAARPGARAPRRSRPR